MTVQGAYGQRLADLCDFPSAPSFVSRSIRKGEIAVTEIKLDGAHRDPTPPLPSEDAFLVALSLRDGFHRDLWVDGRPVPEVPPLPAGIVTFLDLRSRASARYKSALHSVQFYLSRKALDAIADEAGVSRIDGFQLRPGVAITDPVILNLGLSLLPAFEKPDQVSQLFVDHVTLAMAAHTLHTYAGVLLQPHVVRGGLAPWQENRAKEILAANIDGGIPLSRLAAECQLSTRHFSRAFRQSTGMPPHRWLQDLRIQKAKELLRGSSMSLADVAATCGFAGQSHFTRMFRQAVGVSPGAWRRWMTIRPAPKPLR